ncbi:MAG: hypothetical protein KUG82_21905 [Pseudomonadales bacterium]|nr:hypothetical protein [Pseudomonadales bacterium]
MFSITTEIIVFSLLILFSIMAVAPMTVLGHPEFTNVALDICHFPAFWCLQVILHGLLKRHPPLSGKENLIIALGGSLSLAVILEYIQPYFHRTQNPEDLILGALGIAFAATQYTHRMSILASVTAKGLLIVIIVITAIVIYPKIYLLHLRSNTIPHLGNFENNFDIKLWRNVNHIKKPALKRVQHPTEAGQYLMEGYALDYRWSGISFENKEGFDISDYTQFEFDFYSEPPPVTLHLRIDDIMGRKFYAEFDAASNWSHVKFDLTLEKTKQLDTTNISNVAIFYETETGPLCYKFDSFIFK